MVLKINDEWGARLFYGGLIALLLGLFVWFFHYWMVEASFFFALSVVYAVLVYRFASHSERAFEVMLWSCFVNFVALISIEDAVLGFPASGPWLLGFIAGSIAGGYVWTGRRSGSEFKQRKRKPEADGSFNGGWRLALTNGVCAIVLLGIGTAQLAFLSPTAAAAGGACCRCHRGLGTVPFPSAAAHQKRSHHDGPAGCFLRVNIRGRCHRPNGPSLCVGLRRPRRHPDRRAVLVRPTVRGAPAALLHSGPAPSAETSAPVEAEAKART